MRLMDRGQYVYDPAPPRRRLSVGLVKQDRRGEDERRDDPDVQARERRIREYAERTARMEGRAEPDHAQ